MEVLSSVAEAIETVRQTMEVISLTSSGHFGGGGGNIGGAAKFSTCMPLVSV